MEFQEITAYTSAIERDIIHAHQLLKDGVEESLADLDSSLSKARSSLQHQSMAELRALVKDGDKALDEVQHQLGQINFINHAHDLKSIKDFDRLIGPLLKSIKEARETIDSVDLDSSKHLAEYTGALAQSWRDLHLHLEMIRFELNLAESVTSCRLGPVRNEVMEGFKIAVEKHRANQAKTPVEKYLKPILVTGVAAIDSLMTLLQWPDFFSQNNPKN